MPKAVNPPDPSPTEFQDLYLIAVPLSTYKKLVEEAAKRNMTFAQLLSVAVDDFLKKGT